MHTTTHSPQSFTGFCLLGTAAWGPSHSLASLREPVIANDKIQLTYSATSGRLTSIAAVDGSWQQPVTQSLMYYEGSVGEEEGAQLGQKSQPSGAYIFRPAGTAPVNIFASK